MTRLKVVLRSLAVLAAACTPAVALAQPSDSDDVRQLTARVSLLEGRVSYARGDDPDDWQAADFNVPMTIGDRLYSDDGSRAELQVHGGFYVRLGARADLAVLNLTYDTKQFSVKSGSAAFQLRRLGEDEVFEVDTPNAAVTLERTGDYRVDVDDQGNTRVLVRRGRAMVTSGGGQVPVNAGDEMDIDGIDAPRYDVVALSEPDGFDQWVGERERRFEHVRSSEYVHADIVGADDLDQYGRWERHPQYGYVWSPASVEVGWVPYRAGHWVWQDPWGWTWIAAEPWGWAPYHYGRWVTWNSSWWWVPVAPAVRVVHYAPALVAFCGGGPGWSPTVTVAAGGFIGWFPLAPRDPFFHWWGPRVAVASVTHVTYVNQTYITVVNHNTFVSGGVVTTNIVRDRSVVTSVMSAPVLRGPLPVVPTAAATRVAVRQNQPAPPPPPQAVVARPVVARAAPPPPPPAFEAKVAVIRQNRGAPVAAATAAHIVETDKSAARPVVAVRSAVVPAGDVKLAPKKENSRAPKPEPAVPVRGRQPASETTSAPATGTSTVPADRGRPPGFERQPTAPPRGGPPPTPAPERRRRPEYEKPPTRPAPPPPTPAPERGRPAEVEKRPAGEPQQPPAAQHREPPPDKEKAAKEEKASKEKPKEKPKEKQPKEKPTPHKDEKNSN
jgi:hypothetical protein